MARYRVAIICSCVAQKARFFFRKHQIVIFLNKNNILKLEKKHSKYSWLEEDLKINNHYKERIITKTPSCPNCCKEFSKQDIESMLENYEEFIY